MKFENKKVRSLRVSYLFSLFPFFPIIPIISHKKLKTLNSQHSTLNFIEGENLPDFWIREDNDTYYIFVANPMTQTIEYPLDYCYAFTDQGATRQITVNHHGKTEAYTLNFKPMESIMLKVDANGIEQINLGFEPKRMREQ